MKRTKHNPLRKKEASFIKFTEVQSNYLLELKARHLKERDDALVSVYKELNILEEILKTPDAYLLRPDLSGLDIVPIEPNKKEN